MYVSELSAFQELKAVHQIIMLYNEHQCHQFGTISVQFSHNWWL